MYEILRNDWEGDTEAECQPLQIFPRAVSILGLVDTFIMRQMMK
jgi:hypothetical protein